MSSENNPLKEKLEAYLSNRLQSEVQVSKMIPLTGGACQDNYLTDINVLQGESSGLHSLVFRTDKGASLFSSLSRVEEYYVIQLAYSAGVKTPKPIWLEDGREAIGSPFYFMERISGRANGRYIVKDPKLNAVRKKFSTFLAENLSKIHTVTPEKCSDSEFRKKLSRFTDGEPFSVAKLAIEELKTQVNSLKEPHPAIDLMINWLEENVKSTDFPVLVHGDFRTGNFMVTPEEVTGIVDWEFAHFGDRHEDIAWLCMRDWRFGKLNKEVGGFATREEFYADYEKFSGIKVDPAKVTFWEVIGNLRWACGSSAQAERHISGADKGIELASIGRRTSEMELEAMRLIENAG